MEVLEDLQVLQPDVGEHSQNEWIYWQMVSF